MVDSGVSPSFGSGSAAGGGGPVRPVGRSGTETQAPPPAVPLAEMPPPVGPPSAMVTPTATPVAEPLASSLGVRVEQASSSNVVNMKELLHKVVALGGSDLHLSALTPPNVRIDGEMKPMDGVPPLTSEQVEEAVFSILSPEQREEFQSNKELDFAYALEDGTRFRGNVMYERQHVAAVLRAIPTQILPLEALGMPKVLYNFASLPRGLVLVTGPTGSGKSTTLAAMIDHINQNRSGNIITVEDPIEFLHTHGSCVVRQREIGADTESYSAALKHILRQDPDVILIGELRDLETISIALTAAETGHLVLATLHTQSAAETVTRLIDVFPGSQQQQIRSQVAATLKGVVCQTLIKRADNKGRVPAAEIMVVNNAISAQIRNDETHQIPQSLQGGGKEGMQTLNMHLARLVVSETIERQAAEEKSNDLQDLASLIDGNMKRRKNLADLGGGLSGASI